MRPYGLKYSVRVGYRIGYRKLDPEMGRTISVMCGHCWRLRPFRDRQLEPSSQTERPTHVLWSIGPFQTCSDTNQAPIGRFSPMVRNDPLRRVGRWTLQNELGKGGNAIVWRAIEDETGREVALKVIHTNKLAKEPYQRFVREIETLRALGNRSGVLPLIDAYLPGAPGLNDRPWLAMPIATPIDRALKGADLQRVVAALGEIAETLASLAAEKGLGHRDIKPGNLYYLNGLWLIGDFGLVDVPDLPELTRSGRPLGAAHYTPYEMLIDPVHANPHAADVYSFGKTLWVLATEQSFPPEGHQPAGTRKFSIADLRPQQHSEALDRLVDLMTRIHPEERPSKMQVARDLRAWEELSKQPVSVNVSEIGSRLRRKMTQELADEDRLEERKEHALAAVRLLQELTKPLNDALRTVHPRPEIDMMDDKLTQNIARTSETMGSAPHCFPMAAMQSNRIRTRL